MQRALDLAGSRPGRLPSEVVTWYRNAELLKSPLVAQDVANSVAFLVSDNARNYTGAVFDLNNGFHL